MIPPTLVAFCLVYPTSLMVDVPCGKEGFHEGGFLNFNYYNQVRADMILMILVRRTRGFSKKGKQLTEHVVEAFRQVE